MEHLLTWPERGRLWLRLGIRGGLAVAAVLLVIYVVVPLVYLLMPFVLALLLAWALNPIVRRLKEKMTLSRKTISLAVLVLVLAAAGGVCYGVGRMLVSQLKLLFENWELLLDGAVATAERAGELVRRVGSVLPEPIADTGDELLGLLTRWLNSLDLSSRITALAGHAADFVAAIPGFAVAAVVFLTASYFITSDYPRLRWTVTDQLPASTRRFLSQVKRISMEAFGGYLKSQLLLSLGVFVLLAAGLFVIRQPYSLLLAFGLAVMDFIPLIGAGTALAPWAVVELITGSYRQAAELMAVWGAVVVFRRVAEPKVLGNQTGLSPILSLLGIYVGMKAGGVLGMVLGPVVLLVLLNLSRLGVFRPVTEDLRRAAADVSAILKSGASE